MKESRDGHGAYVRRVQEGTHSFTHDLDERTREIRQALAANEALRTFAASLEAEMNRLHEQAVALRAANERHESEQQRLRALLDRTRAESRGYSSRYAEIEAQNSNLANLYVASYRLHGTLERKEVIDTLQEIIANLIGSEQAGLYELNAAKQSLELVATHAATALYCASLHARLQEQEVVR
jgi:chromosome segregation ATPase